MSRKEKKDWSLDTLLSVVGFVFELVRVVVNALRRRDGTVDHLRRLLNEPALVDQVFDLIVVKAAALPLPPDHYSVFVPYGPVPPYAELDKKLFGSSSELWDGTKYALQSHETCKDVDETPGNKEFWLPCFGREITSDEAIKEADKVGFRPPTFMESLAFAAAHPDLQRKFWIVILGCFVLCNDFWRVPVLLSSGGGRRLDYRWFGGRWDAGYRFLFVRK